MRGVNFHGKFEMGIPRNSNCNNTQVQKPRNSQKFQVNCQQDFELQGIPTQSTNDFP